MWTNNSFRYQYSSVLYSVVYVTLKAQLTNIHTHRIYWYKTTLYNWTQLSLHTHYLFSNTCACSHQTTLKSHTHVHAHSITHILTAAEVRNTELSFFRTLCTRWWWGASHIWTSGIYVNITTVVDKIGTRVTCFVHIHIILYTC